MIKDFFYMLYKNCFIYIHVPEKKPHMNWCFWILIFWDLVYIHIYIYIHVPEFFFIHNKKSFIIK